MNQDMDVCSRPWSYLIASGLSVVVVSIGWSHSSMMESRTRAGPQAVLTSALDNIEAHRLWTHGAWNTV